jgi:uncharacterized protein YbaP (TraB family)
MRPRWSAFRLVGVWPALLALILIGLAGAGPSAAETPRAFGQGRLWQVSQAGVAPSHIFGTMHVTDGDVVALPAAVDEAFARSDRLVLEVVLTRKNFMRLAQAMIFTDGRSLSDVVGPKLYAEVGRIAGRYGLPGAQMNQFRPWAVSTMFSVPPAELKRQAAGHVMLDRMLQDQAALRGTPVFDLEDVEEQIAIFTGISERDQVEILKWTLRMNAQIDGIFKTLKRAYLKGDLDRLHAIAGELSTGTDPRLMKLFNRRLIDSRNDLMVKRMGRHLKRGRAFIAVGALHISGEVGILRLLQKKGYKVKRVL